MGGRKGGREEGRERGRERRSAGKVADTMTNHAPNQDVKLQKWEI